MKRMMLTSLILVTVLALLLAGCGGGQETPANQTNEIKATIETKPSKPAVNQETVFRVTVTEPNQAGNIEKAQVTLFLEMKEMDHGENRIALTEVEPGVYQGKGKFPMSGAWQAHVRVEKEGQTRSTNVDLKVE